MASASKGGQTSRDEVVNLDRLGHFHGGAFQSHDPSFDPGRSAGLVHGYKLANIDKQGHPVPSMVKGADPFVQHEMMTAVDHSENASRGGLQRRPGFHMTPAPRAPQLMTREGNVPANRAWFRATMPQETTVTTQRPESQGGNWYLGGHMALGDRVSEAELAPHQEATRRQKADQALRSKGKTAGQNSFMSVPSMAGGFHTELAPKGNAALHPIQFGG